jgi:hypothetical protein
MKTSMILPDDVWEAAKNRATKERKSLAAIVTDALRAHLGLPDPKHSKRKKGGANG